MTDDELETFMRLMEQAQSEEEKRRIQEQWLPHLSRCLVSTNRHVKAVEEALQELGTNIVDIKNKIDRLQAAPTWKEDKWGWLKANWMWCVIMLYMLQNLFGVNVASLIERFIK